MECSGEEEEKEEEEEVTPARPTGTGNDEELNHVFFRSKNSNLKLRQKFLSEYHGLHR